MAQSETAAGQNPYRIWQVKIFAATWLAYAGYYFCRKAFYVVKAEMADVLHFTTHDLAHLGTAYLLSYMVGQFSSAYFGRKLGPKLLLLVGMGISIICNVVFGVSNGFWTVFLFLALNGLAQGTGWPGCIGSLAFWFKRKQRGSVLGVWSTCYQLGSVLAVSFAAFLLGALGWRASFFGASVVLLVVWALVLWLHPNRPEDVGLDPIETPEGDETGGKVARPSQEAKETLGWSREVVTTILLMGAIYFCIKFLRYALWSWSPFFLHRNFGLAGDDAGYISTVFDIAGFIGVIFAGFVTDKLFHGRRAFVAMAMILLMAVSFVVMYLWGSASLLVFTISMGSVGFMLFGPDSLISGVGAIDVGSTKGALVAAGIINGMGSIGPVFQEQIIGWMYDFFDQRLGPILMVLMVVAALCFVLTMALWLKARMGRANI